MKFNMDKKRQESKEGPETVKTNKVNGKIISFKTNNQSKAADKIFGRQVEPERQISAGHKQDNCSKRND